MSLIFYADNEETAKEESINKYEDLLEEYTIKCPTLKEALKQMFISSGASKNKAEELTNTILTEVKDFIEPKFDEIKKKYSNITLDDAFTICSYTYELYGDDSIYNIYKLLNTNLVSNNRMQGIRNISKYLFLLLKSLRKLSRYYPKKYLYRCISVLVKLDYDSFNKKFVPYIEGNEKTFWGFTSTSSEIKTCYNFLGTTKKSGTIFSLSGDIWGYDISLFNVCGEEEILLEPERKLIVEESLPEVNGIIFVRCSIKSTPLVLENLFKSQKISSLTKGIKNIKLNTEMSVQDIFQSEEFNELNINDFINKYKNHKYFTKLKELKEFFTEFLSEARFALRELDNRGNKIDWFSINEKRGNLPYNPPIGWFGIGLKVLEKFDEGNDLWIGNNNSKNEWCVAYHGVGSGQPSNVLKRILGHIIRGGFKEGIRQIHSECKDLNHPGKIVGVGVYFCENINTAGAYAGEFEIYNKKYKTVLMVRIKPKAIRKCECMHDFLVVNGTYNEVRPYRILFKEV